MIPHPRVCLSLFVPPFRGVLHRVHRGAALACFVSPVFAQTIGGGADHTVVAKPDGTVWVWGSNGSGQLGNGSTSPSVRRVPDQVPELSNVTAVAAGSQK